MVKHHNRHRKENQGTIDCHGPTVSQPPPYECQSPPHITAIVTPTTLLNTIVLAVITLALPNRRHITPLSHITPHLDIAPHGITPLPLTPLHPTHRITLAPSRDIFIERDIISIIITITLATGPFFSPKLHVGRFTC